MALGGSFISICSIGASGRRSRGNCFRATGFIFRAKGESQAC